MSQWLKAHTTLAKTPNTGSITYNGWVTAVNSWDLTMSPDLSWNSDGSYRELQNKQLKGLSVLPHLF